MKAVVVSEFTPFDQARCAELDEPRPGPNEVVVDVEAADVNFPDILYIEGKYQKKPALPFSPGLAGVGRLSALGPGVEGLELGSKVLVLPHYGTFAEKVRAPAGFCFPMPDAMPAEIGAAFGLVYQTAYFALIERAALSPGETVLVLGATGGVGMAAVQLAKALGAGKVIAATRGDKGAALARSLGADVTIDAATPNLRDGLRDAVHGETDGRGADVVIDPVGGDLCTAALRAIAWSGRLVVVGFASGTIPQFGANYLLVKNVSVSGLQWTDYRERRPERVREAQEHIFRLWEEGRVAPRIAKTLPLERFAEALADLQSAKADGKIVLLTGRERG